MCGVNLVTECILVLYDNCTYGIYLIQFNLSLCETFLMIAPTVLPTFSVIPSAFGLYADVFYLSIFKLAHNMSNILLQNSLP